MRIIPATVTLFILLATSTATQAADPYLGLELGGGDINFDASSLAPIDFGTSTIGDDVAVAGVVGGLAFQSGWLAELSVEDYDTIDFLLLADSVSVNTVRIGAGYAPEPAGRFGFVAKFGVSFWSLEARESPFLNPGLELTVKDDGASPYVQIGGEFQFTDSFRTGLVFDYSDTGFGDTSALKLTLRYIFR